MDLSVIINTLVTNFSWPLLVITILFIVSEVLGAHPTTKAGSLYQVLKALVGAFKDQVIPPKQAVPAPVEPTQVEPTTTPSVQ